MGWIAAQIADICNRMQFLSIRWPANYPDAIFSAAGAVKASSNGQTGGVSEDLRDKLNSLQNLTREDVLALNKHFGANSREMHTILNAAQAGNPHAIEAVKGWPMDGFEEGTAAGSIGSVVILLICAQLGNENAVRVLRDIEPGDWVDEAKDYIVESKAAGDETGVEVYGSIVVDLIRLGNLGIIGKALAFTRDENESVRGYFKKALRNVDVDVIKGLAAEGSFIYVTILDRLAAEPIDNTIAQSALRNLGPDNFFEEIQYGTDKNSINRALAAVKGLADHGNVGAILLLGRVTENLPAIFSFNINVAEEAAKILKNVPGDVVAGIFRGLEHLRKAGETGENYILALHLLRIAENKAALRIPRTVPEPRSPVKN